MKIYYAHSIKGSHTPWERSPQDIIPLLQQAWHEVVSEEIFTSQTTLSDAEIFERDTEMIRSSDCILANVSNPTLWVGREIAYSESLNKKILCFWQSSINKKISSMITGNPNIKYYAIDSVDEILKLL